MGPPLALAVLLCAASAAAAYAPRDVHVVVTGSASHALGVVACVRSVVLEGVVVVLHCSVWAVVC